MSVLVSWPVVVIVVPLLIGIGIGVLSMTPPEFVLARCCFALAAALFLGKVGWWLAGSEIARLEKAFLAFLLFGAAGWGWVESWRWIASREALAIEARSQKPPEPPKVEIPEAPDVTLRFIYPNEPALVLVNQSGVTARDIKWTVALWNLDMPERTDPLPISVSASLLAMARTTQILCRFRTRKYFRHSST